MIIKFILTLIMDFLPQELENIIINYKHQLEHKETYQRCMNELLNMKRYTKYHYDVYRYNNMLFIPPINSINGVLYVHNGITNHMIFTEYTTRITIRSTYY